MEIFFLGVSRDSSHLILKIFSITKNLLNFRNLNSVKSNQVGRLGYAKPSVVLKPQKVQFPDSVKISFISTSDNHTVFISKNGRAYVCGSNQIGQLGLGPDIKAVELPRVINFGEGMYTGYNIRKISV